MSLRAGTLNRRVTIQQRLDSRDAAGQPVDAWATVAQVWGNILAPTGMGAIRDMQGDLSASVARVSIRMRYRTDINAGMRAVCGSQTFDIQGVLPDQAGHEYTDLVCETQGPTTAVPEGSIQGGDAFGTGVGSISGGGA